MLRGLLLVVYAALAATAHAQTTVVAPGPAQRCLTRGEVLLGTPNYPQDAYAMKAHGRVIVSLEFSAADTAPQVIELTTKADARYERSFEKAVREFIAAYRVPCLAAGETSKLRQEFIFIPHDMSGVTMLASSDPDEERKAKLRACVRVPQDRPTYPESALNADRQGTVVTKVVFNGADEPPQVSVLDDADSAAFARSVSSFAQRIRMPCHDGQGPVDYLMLFIFTLQGGSRVVLKDLPLTTLLGSMKGIKQAQVYFDFNTMGCPFEVHFEPWQPYGRNKVGEVGTPNPERRFFLDWLSRQQLDLKRREANAVIGQGARISVPCTVLHLGPRSGGGASQ